MKIQENVATLIVSDVPDRLLAVLAPRFHRRQVRSAKSFSVDEAHASESDPDPVLCCVVDPECQVVTVIEVIYS